MPHPLAYLLTWTTYGSWLHGDPRGSADRHNATRAHPYHPGNPAWREASRQRMKGPSVRLTEAMRRVALAAVLEHCRHKGWSAVAADCLSTHVHVVVAAPGEPPERVMTELKAYATRALRREGLAAKGKLWTRGGSTRYLWTPASVGAAGRYVRNQ